MNTKRKPDAGSLNYVDFLCPWTDHGEEHLYGMTPKELREWLLELTQVEYSSRVFLPTKVGPVH